MAHIYGSKAKGWTLYRTAGAAFENEAIVGNYSSKAEARRMARKFGLTAHNF